MEKETIKTIFSLKNSKLDANNLSNWLNSHSRRTFDLFEGLISSSKETQELFTEIAIMWVMYLKYEADYNVYDERNKESVIRGKRIYTVIEKEINNIFSDYTSYVIQRSNNNTDFDELISKLEHSDSNWFQDFLDKSKYSLYFINYFKQDHRTIQQLFTGFVFYWLINFPNFLRKENEDYKNIYLKLKKFEIENKSIYALPFI